MQTPRDKKKDLKKANFSKLPKWSKIELEKAFIIIRDSRFLPCSNYVNNLRTIPWFYVENGCFARASLANRALKLNNIKPIGKLFIWGDLKLKTEWTLSGIATFRDHVSLSCIVDDQVYVLDPTIDYQKALTLEKWSSKLTSLSSNKKVSISVCNPLTVSHNSDCSEQSVLNEIAFRELKMPDSSKKKYPLTLEYLTQEYLSNEYKIAILLGKDPDALFLQKNIL